MCEICFVLNTFLLYKLNTIVKKKQQTIVMWCSFGILISRSGKKKKPQLPAAFWWKSTA